MKSIWIHTYRVLYKWIAIYKALKPTKQLCLWRHPSRHLLMRSSALSEFLLEGLNLSVVDGAQWADVRQRMLVFLRQTLHLPRSSQGVKPLRRYLVPSVLLWGCWGAGVGKGWQQEKEKPRWQAGVLVVLLFAFLGGVNDNESQRKKHAAGYSWIFLGKWLYTFMWLHVSWGQTNPLASWPMDDRCICGWLGKSKVLPTPAVVMFCKTCDMR